MSVAPPLAENGIIEDSSTISLTFNTSYFNHRTEKKVLAETTYQLPLLTIHNATDSWLLMRMAETRIHGGHSDKVALKLVNPQLSDQGIGDMFKELASLECRIRHIDFDPNANGADAIRRGISDAIWVREEQRNSQMPAPAVQSPNQREPLMHEREPFKGDASIGY